MSSIYTKLQASDVKPGDKVRLVVEPFLIDEGLTKGGIYEVSSTSCEDIIVKLPNGSRSRSWMAKRFEKVVEETSPASLKFIVALEQNGQYAPATTPKQYRSLKQAEAVAQSMAERHGQVFYVLQPVAKAIPPVKIEAKLEKISL
jgi:hypothetical protein